MDEFTIKVTRLKSDLLTLEEYIEAFKTKIRVKFTTVHDSNTEKSLTNDIKTIEQIFKEKVHSIKESLESIDQENQEMLNQGYEIETSFLYETRKSHFNALTNRLTKTVTSFRKEQLNFLNKEEDRALSKYMIENQGLTIEEAKKQMKNEDKGSQGARNKLESAEERNRNVNEILKSVQEIAGLIDELDELVKRQGTSIQKIEEITDENVKRTEKAKKSLKGALDIQRRITFWKRVGLCVLGVILLVILVWVVSKFSRQKGSGGNNGNQNNQ